MDRRKLLKGAGLATIGATAALVSGCSEETGTTTNASEGTPAAPAVARRKRTLKMVTTWPRNFPGLGTGANEVARRITEATDGELTIEVHAAGELVPAFEAFDAVSSGAADAYHGADYYWQGKSPAYAFFTSIPFGLSTLENMAWIMTGGGQELWDELGAGFNIKPLPATNTGTQMGGWFNREINSIDDLTGLKMRIPGIGGEVLRRLGVAAVNLPGSEIFQSMQTGAIDATEWVGPWNDLAFGFHRVAKNYYYPGFHEPGSILAMGWNLDIWTSLTDAQRRIATDAAHATMMSTLAEYQLRDAQALKTLINEHEVVLRRMPDDVLTAIGQKSAEVVREIGTGGDDLTRRVYESFLEARRRGMDWGTYNEEAFTTMRRLDVDFG